MRRAALLALALVAASPAPLRAQDPPADTITTEQLVELGFKYRRQGELDAATAAFDQAIARSKSAAEKKTIALESYDVACVASRFERAARTARGYDVAMQARALALARRGDDALRVAREGHDAFAEGTVLALLGRNDEALSALARSGERGLAARAELLSKLGRFAEAAKDSEKEGNYFARAVALERAGDPGAAQAWEPARADVKRRLETLIARGSEVKARLQAAQGVIARERARLVLAETEGDLSKEYEHYAIVHSKTGERAKAAKLTQLALEFAQESRRLLTDSGADRYGEACAEALGLAERERALRDRLRDLD
jgi:tetratricopeptide (TPR) repeat protein